MSRLDLTFSTRVEKYVLCLALRYNGSLELEFHTRSQTFRTKLYTTTFLKLGKQLWQNAFRIERQHEINDTEQWMSMASNDIMSEKNKSRHFLLLIFWGITIYVNVCLKIKMVLFDYYHSNNNFVRNRVFLNILIKLKISKMKSWKICAMHLEL